MKWRFVYPLYRRVTLPILIDPHPPSLRLCAHEHALSSSILQASPRSFPHPPRCILLSLSFRSLFLIVFSLFSDVRPLSLCLRSFLHSTTRTVPPRQPLREETHFRKRKKKKRKRREKSIRCADWPRPASRASLFVRDALVGVA